MGRVNLFSENMTSRTPGYDLGDFVLLMSRS